MRTELEELKTGWYQVYLRFRPDEVDQLIDALQNMKKTRGHFHLASDHRDPAGVADIEISLQGPDERDNMTAFF